MELVQIKLSKENYLIDLYVNVLFDSTSILKNIRYFHLLLRI